MSMDQNPYESPQPDPPHDASTHEATPLSLYRNAKRNTGLAAVLLLTPPAIAIATFTTCAIGINGPYLPYLLTCFGVPLAVLVSSLVLASFVRARRNTNPNRSKYFQIVLALTPICMIAAVGVGFWLAIQAGEFTGFPHGNPFPGAVWAIPIAFFLPPTATLMLMLWLAWRHR